MSLQTWKDEFYPIPAATTCSGSAVKYSLLKWEGLRREALAKHECLYSDSGCAIYDNAGSSLRVSSSTCALCIHFYEKSGCTVYCEKCPLAIARGGYACDEVMGDEESSPWHMMTLHADPEYMIKWLQKALDSKHKA